MEQSNLYEAIFKRKSIRKYDLSPLDEKTLSEITAQIHTLKPVDDSIKTEIKLVSQNDVSTMLPKAPHYLVAFSETKEGYLTNVGFMLQQMDLFLSAKGIGSCWQGMVKPKKEIISESKLKFVIVLAVGKPAEKLYRESVGDFERKPLQQVTNITGMDQLLESARLAPSGINSQPWFFTGGDGIIHAYCVKTNFIKAIVFKKMNKIDMGIGICHLWIAARHSGRNVEFIIDKAAQKNGPAGFYYINSLKLIKLS